MTETLAGTLPAQDRLLSERDGTRVLRRRIPGAAPLIVKQALDGQAAKRLAHEARLLQALASVGGVVRLAAPWTAGTELLLQDEGAVSLSERLAQAPLSLLQAVELAVAVTRILGGVHRAGVVHRDVCPGNLLVDAVSLRPTLIDFKLARQEGSPDTVLPGEIVGTWKSMSPEHTGRTGRRIDTRSDLYSLGILLYELIVKRPPFEGEDLLDLVHDHLVAVPVAPAVLDPLMPEVLSRVVLRLLEKEPERRYQSAEGLLKDLQSVVEGLRTGRVTDFELGQADFGARLSAPTALIGRDPECAALDAALKAPAPASPCVLVHGPAGVGKSALVASLRSHAEACRGWLLSAKFERFSQDADGGGMEALRSLARQLLAEPEARLNEHKARILASLGSNLGVGPTLLPEFQLLLGEHDEVTLHDPREATSRTAQATLSLLRGVASLERPVTLVLDDAQHAPSWTLRFLDALVTGAEPVPGLHVVCTFRDADVVGEHPLGKLIQRWQSVRVPAADVPLRNFDAAQATALLGSMLRTNDAKAQPLAALLAERTDNNPDDLIEHLNSLRDDQLLVLTDGEWQWEADAIRRHVGSSSVEDLMSRRIGKLPPDALEAVQAAACIGREFALDLLADATALGAESVSAHLAPVIDDGLVTLDAGDANRAQFGNVRVQQAVLTGMDTPMRERRQADLARRLVATAAGRPTWLSAASDQYLAALPQLADEAECRLAAELFEQSAHRLRLHNHAAAERFLSAAVEALLRVERPEDSARLMALQVEQHKALFSLGRLDQGDEVYAALLARSAEAPLDVAEATRVQMFSLTNRRRFADGMAVAMGMLARLGLNKPQDMRPDIGAGFKRLAMWSRSAEKLRDKDRPPIADPRILAWSSIISEAGTPVYFSDPTTYAWLMLEAHRVWVEHGPAPYLLGAAASVPLLMTGLPQDYRGAYEASRHLISVGTALGYEPHTMAARCLFGIAAGHWVEPIEDVLAAMRTARADLIRTGEEHFVTFTYLTSDLLFDGATLADAAAEVESGMAFAVRSGNADHRLRNLPRQQLIRALQGRTTPMGALADADFDEADFVKNMDSAGPTATVYHVMRSVSALLFGDAAALAEHAGKAIPLLARTPGYYMTANARALQAIALADKLRTLAADERGPVLAELDAHLQWLTLRAVDAPANFLHLQRWIEAERAGAVESVWAAGSAFDAAVAEARLHARPWHQAAILERAASFRLGLGMEAEAQPLFIEACALYEGWGAEGKVRQMRNAHAFLRHRGAGKAGARHAAANASNGEAVETMAVLRASQALSSETSLPRLTERIGRVLSTLSGAVDVHLIVHQDGEGAGWVMASSLADGMVPITVEQAGAEGVIPLTAFRYVERTRDVLVIDDVLRDDRFSDDPFADAYDQCSLMVAPVLKQGQLHAMLVLTNPQRRGAFDSDRLESVNMIAGQLSVSLDNALLYTSLEKRVAERTAQLRQKTQDIHAMLQNLPQGVLTVAPGGIVHPEYSAYLEDILGHTDIAGQSVMSLIFNHSDLGADALSQLDAAIGSCIGEDEMNYAFNAHLLITECQWTPMSGTAKALAFSWSPIGADDGTVDKLMLCVRDVTELKRLEGEANQRKRELQMIGEILAVTQEKFQEFIEGSRGFVAENRRLTEAATAKDSALMDVLFRNMHTIKGNARTYALLELTNLVHTTEQGYDDLRKNDDIPWDRELLLAQLDAVSALIERHAHVNDVVLGRKGPGRRGQVDKYLMVDRDTVQQTLQLLAGVDPADLPAVREALGQTGRILHLMGTEPLQEILAGTINSLPSLAHELGKLPPTVAVEARGLVIRTQASRLLRNLFTHLLRNAVDHGLEVPEVRAESGKPLAGRIDVDLALHAGQLHIRIHDDGRGLAIARIRHKALEAGLIAPGATPSADEVAQLVFSAGLSTAEQVTEVSGRGVGMDAVKCFIEEQGGSIRIRLLGGDPDADFRAFDTLITLPEKFAASENGDLSFEALHAPGAAAADALP